MNTGPMYMKFVGDLMEIGVSQSTAMMLYERTHQTPIVSPQESRFFLNLRTHYAEEQHGKDIADAGWELQR